MGKESIKGRGAAKGMCGPVHADEGDRGTILRGGEIYPTSADVEARAKTNFKINPFVESQRCDGESKRGRR